MEDFPFDDFAGREAADGGEDLCALAFRARADLVIAIAAVEQFVLVAGEEVTLITQQILADDGVTRTIRATLPKGIGTQRFVRLKVTQ